MFEQVLTDSKTKDRYSRKKFAFEIHSYLAWMAEKGYAGDNDGQTSLSAVFL